MAHWESNPLPPHRAIFKIAERLYHVSYWEHTPVLVPFIVVI